MFISCQFLPNMPQLVNNTSQLLKLFQATCVVIFCQRFTLLCRFIYLQVHGNLQPPSKLKVIWPKKCTLRRLRTIHIRGFSGELELMRLLSFLLKRSPVLKKLVIDTHPHKYKAFSKWKRERSEDATRCNYTRGVALTHLPREIPSTVKFRVI